MLSIVVEVQRCRGAEVRGAGRCRRRIGARCEVARWRGGEVARWRGGCVLVRQWELGVGVLLGAVHGCLVLRLRWLKG